MSPRTWPDDWDARRAGAGCFMCAEERTDVDAKGNRRFFTGRFTDAYLQREAPARGYAVVMWRGRHVPDVSEMTSQELTDFWREVAEVARAMTKAFEPCQLNYQLLGNAVPHVHTHIVPRYVNDPCPNMPLQPWTTHAVPDAELAADVERVRTALAR